MGWRVLVVWECALKGKEKLPLERVFGYIEEWVRGSAPLCILDSKGLVREYVKE